MCVIETSPVVETRRLILRAPGAQDVSRIAAMAKELGKLGVTVEEGIDFIRVTPPEKKDWMPASIHTYDDHRIAMCFSLAAFNPAGVRVRIQDPKCVAKTFPEYFETLLSVATSDKK